MFGVHQAFRVRIIAASVIVALMAGCASLDELTENELINNREMIRKQWSESVRHLGFSAVFPPTEDVEVGDIFAVPKFCDESTEDAKAAGAPNSVKIDSVNLRKALDEYYSRRFQFGDTLTVEATDGGKTTKLLDHQPPSREGVFNTSHRQYLPLQALPAFELAKGSFNNVSAAIPLPFAEIFGAAQEKENLKLTISVPRSETYQLPAYAMMDILDRYCRGELPKSWLNPGPASLLRKTSKPCAELLLENVVRVSTPQPFNLKVCDPQPFIVSRVFSTRQIDYEYAFDKSSAFAAEVDVTLDRAIAWQQRAQELLSSKGQNPNPVSPGPEITAKKGSTVTVPSVPAPKITAEEGATVNVVPPQATQPGTADALLQTVLSQVSDDLEKIRQSPVPAGRFSFARSSQNKITLTQIFERPIVIGYAAVGGPPILLSIHHPKTIDGTTNDHREITPTIPGGTILRAPNRRR